MAPLRRLLSIAERCRNNQRRGHNCATWWPRLPLDPSVTVHHVNPRIPRPFPLDFYYYYYVIYLRFCQRVRERERAERQGSESGGGGGGVDSNGEESRDSAKFDSEWS